MAERLLAHVKSGQVPEQSIYYYHLADDITDILKRVTVTATCDVSVTVGAVVIFTGEDTIEALTDNLNDAAQGIVVNKPSTTTADVIMMGTAQFIGVAQGETVFLSETAALTTTQPITGFIQHLGVGIDADVMFFRPSQFRVWNEV